MAGKLVIGNWKMHGSLAGNIGLLAELKAGWSAVPHVRMMLAPPAVYLAQLQGLLSGSPIGWGAQDVADQVSGAYTGEISADMLAEFGCGFALVGHSERRARFLESDVLIANKAVAALQAGLTPVVCIGETRDQREADQARDVLARQISVVLERVPTEDLARLVVAYEPRWAIGSGDSADPQAVGRIHTFLRERLRDRDSSAASRIPILYGGSVNPSNAAEYAAQRDVDGVLVGGASLKALEFLQIGAAFVARD